MRRDTRRDLWERHRRGNGGARTSPPVRRATRAADERLRASFATRWAVKRGIERPHTGALLVPVSEVRDNPPWGPKCVIDLPVRGRGERSGRAANVRTVWEIAGSGVPPRLVNAYCKP